MPKEVKNIVEVLESRELLGVDFKIYGTVDEPLFLANDVKEWIGHSNVSVMIRNVDEDEKVLNNVYTLGGNQEMLFLTENGIYEVLMLSRKPIAKQFKTEVKKILKQIRLTGGYIPVKTEESDEDLMARAFIVAQNTIAKKDALLKQAEEKIQIDAPKVEYYEEVLNADACYTFTDVAKYVGLRSAQELKDILWNLEVIWYPDYKMFKGKYVGSKSKWYLTTKHTKKGYVKSKTSPYNNGYGQLKTKTGLVWTEKGREFIYRVLKESNVI